VADPKDGQAPAAVVHAKQKARMIGKRRIADEANR
jgi:hypothetical protein